jgi:hypothetical protein
MAGTTRTELNTHDTQFHLKLVERIYPGSPRWFTDDWHDHCGSVSGDTLGRFSREPSVLKAVYAANMYVPGAASRQFLKTYYKPETPFLVACVNPDCANRFSDIVQTIKYGTPGGTTTYKQLGDKGERDDALKALATGDARDFPRTPCPSCSKKKAAFGFSEIKNKWIYVLKDSGGSLTPDQEIEIWDADNGVIRYKFSGGRFADTVKNFDGQLILPNIKDHTWHFFLSPVRLGPQALKLLQQAPKQDSQYAQKRDAQDPASWQVPVFPDLALQPWTTTVKRKFQSEQLKNGFEFIPLVDYFSWVAQIIEFDFLPILAAQQKLVQDSDEQDKAMIASTLSQVIGKERDENDPSRTKPDPYDVKEEAIPIPSGYHGPGGNVADAWVHRYQEAIEYLTKESNNACCRALFPVRFGFGHRVTEMACQENDSDSAPLALALTHWAHIFRDIAICPPGQAFLVWATKGKDAADRIPQKNILGAAGFRAGSKIAAEIGKGLPLHILTYLTPAIISGNSNPAQLVNQHFQNFGVKTKVVTPKDIVSLSGEALELPAKFVEAYKKGLPEELEPDQIRTASGMAAFKEGMHSFPSLKQTFDLVSLLADLDEWSKKEGESNDWSHFEQTKKKVGSSAKVAQYIAEKAQKLIKDGVEFRKGYSLLSDLKIEEDLADKLMEGASVEGAQAQIVSGSRSLNALKFLGQFKKLLSGPVCFVIGACDAMIKYHEMEEAWESGNMQKVGASALEMMGNVLLVEIAAAETVAWVFGIEALAAGPVGWFAAALILAGSILGLFCEENPLQTFTKACFLGKEYKDPSKMPLWPAVVPNPYSPRNQRFALLRLLTAFTTRIGTAALRQEATADHPVGQTGFIALGVGGMIFPSFVPDGAYFEVKLDCAPAGGEPSEENGYTALVWPMYGRGGDYVWLGKQPLDESVEIVRNGSQVTSIHVRAKPAIAGSVAYNFRVRLVFESSGKNALPKDGYLENKSEDKSGGYHDSNT